MKRLALMLLIAGPLAGCSYQAHEMQQTITPVRVAAVKMYQPKEGDRYSASIAPGRQVTLAFRGSGFVQYLHQVKASGHSRSLEPGDIIPQGTVLARLRQEDYGHQLRQAQAQAEAARQNQQAAQAQLAQAQAGQIKAQADLTDAQVRAARSQLEASTAQIHAADATMAGANLSLRDTALVAPFGAAVVQRNVELGMLVAPGTSAYTLADVSWVKATFGIPDSVAVHLRTGTRVAISVEALPGRTFTGNVTAIAAVSDSETRLFQT